MAAAVKLKITAAAVWLRLSTCGCGAAAAEISTAAQTSGVQKLVREGES